MLCARRTARADSIWLRWPTALEHYPSSMSDQTQSSAVNMMTEQECGYAGGTALS